MFYIHSFKLQNVREFYFYLTFHKKQNISLMTFLFIYFVCNVIHELSLSNQSDTNLLQAHYLHFTKAKRAKSQILLILCYSESNLQFLLGVRILGLS